MYYLWGSERQAVRHFILQNTEWSREQIRSANPVAKRRWPEPIWSLFLEEWELLTEEGLATDEPDADGDRPTAAGNDEDAAEEPPSGEGPRRKDA